MSLLYKVLLCFSKKRHFDSFEAHWAAWWHSGYLTSRRFLGSIPGLGLGLVCQMQLSCL